METAMAAAAIIGITIILLAIRWVIRAGVNRGVNAAANAIRRKQEEYDPHLPENLAQRYGGSEEN